MSFRHRILPSLGLGLLLSLALLFATAAAQTMDGRLQVDGSGSVAVDGKVAVIGAASSRRNATLRVVDRLGDAQVSFNGITLTPRVVAGRREFRVRENGRFLVTGSAVSVDVSGDALSLSIAGVGTARLRGKGTMQVDGGPVQALGNTTVRLGSQARRGNSSGKRKVRNRSVAVARP